MGETLSHTGPAAPRAGTGRKVWVTRKGKAHGRLRLCELTHETSSPAHHVVDVRLMGRFSKFSSTEKKIIFLELHGARHKVFRSLPSQVPVALSHVNTANEAEMIVWN